MFAFYNGSDLFEIMLLLIRKARSQNFTISIIFPTLEEAKIFSAKLWNLHKTIAHGLETDGFTEKQPIILGSHLWPKDVAMILTDTDTNALSKYEKVFFIGNDHNKKLNNNVHNSNYWEYQHSKWINLNQEEFFK